MRIDTAPLLITSRVWLTELDGEHTSRVISPEHEAVSLPTLTRKPKQFIAYWMVGWLRWLRPPACQLQALHVRRETLACETTRPTSTEISETRSEISETRSAEIRNTVRDIGADCTSKRVIPPIPLAAKRCAAALAISSHRGCSHTHRRDTHQHRIETSHHARIRHRHACKHRASTSHHERMLDTPLPSFRRSEPRPTSQLSY